MGKWVEMRVYGSWAVKMIARMSNNDDWE